MGENKTVIDIVAQVTDQTSSGARTAQSNVSKLEKSMQSLQQRITDMKGKSKLEMTASLKDMASAGLTKISNAGKKIAGKAWTVTMKLKDLVTAPFRGIIKAISNPVVQIAATVGLSFGIKDTIDTFKSFQQGMANVQAIVNATDEDMSQLTVCAKELGETTMFSASQAAEAMENLAMAGWKTADIIAGMPGLLDLAAAGSVDLATASDVVSSAIAQFKLNASESSRVANVLAATATNSKTDIQGLGESLKYAGTMAGSLGYSIEDTALALALMGNAGVDASSAGSTVRMMFARMSKQEGLTAEESNAVAEAMKKVGVSLTDNQGKTKSMLTVLQDLRKGFSKLNAAEKTATAANLAGAYSMTGLLAIVDASEEKFNELAEAINNSEGAASRMADVKMDTLQGSMYYLQSAAEGVKIAIGDKLEPYLRGFIDWLTSKMPSIKTVALDTLDVVIDKIQGVQKTIDKMTKSSEWKSASTLWGKIKVAWNTLIAEPFDEWWNSTGRSWLAEKANSVGNFVGNFIKTGLLTLLGVDVDGVMNEGMMIGKAFMEGFLDGFDAEKFVQGIMNAIGAIGKDALTLLPGGEEATSTSGLSAALMGYGLFKVGKAGYSLFKGGKTVLSGAKGIFGALSGAGTAGALSGAGTAAGAGAVNAALSGAAGAAVTTGAAKVAVKRVPGTAANAAATKGTTKVITSRVAGTAGSSAGAGAAGTTAGASVLSVLGKVLGGAAIGTVIGVGIAEASKAISTAVNADAVKAAKRVMNGALFNNGLPKLADYVEEVKESTAQTYNLAKKINYTRVEMSNIEAEMQDAATSVHLFGTSLRDTGTITQQEAENMYEPFNQLCESLEKNFTLRYGVVFDAFKLAASGVADSLGADVATISLTLDKFKEKYIGTIDKTQEEVNSLLEKQTNGENLSAEEISNLQAGIEKINKLANSQVSKPQSDFENAVSNISRMDFGKDTYAAQKTLGELAEYSSAYITELNEAMGNVRLEYDNLRNNYKALFETGDLSQSEYTEVIGTINAAQAFTEIDFQKKIDEYNKRRSELQEALTNQLDSATRAATSELLNSPGAWFTPEAFSGIFTGGNAYYAFYNKAKEDYQGIYDAISDFISNTAYNQSITVKIPVDVQLIAGQIENGTFDLSKITGTNTYPNRPQGRSSLEKYGEPEGVATPIKARPAHANGGIMTSPHIGLVAEDGAEAIIPLSGKRRDRGLSLWKETGRMLGVQEYAEGGIAGKIPITSGGSSSITVDIGGVDIGGFNITVDGNGAPDDIVEIIRSNITGLTDEIAGELAEKLSAVFSNMPLKATE